MNVNIRKLIGALLFAVVSFILPQAAQSAIVRSRIVVGPTQNSSHYEAWKAQVFGSMVASGAYPTDSATVPIGVEFLGSDKLDPHHLVASLPANPSWKAVFPPPSGFENSTGTSLWLFVSVESEVDGNTLMLSTVSANTYSSDGLLNDSNKTFATYSGSVGITAAGDMVYNGPSTTPVKRMYFAVQLKPFLANSQASANSTIAYINNAPNYSVRFGVTGSGESSQWSITRTLNTKTPKSYVGCNVVERKDESGHYFTVVGPSSDLTVKLQYSNDLTKPWQNLGAYSPGDILPLHRFAEEMATFYRLVE